MPVTIDRGENRRIKLCPMGCGTLNYDYETCPVCGTHLTLTPEAVDIEPPVPIDQDKVE